jgi:plastocyanin
MIEPLSQKPAAARSARGSHRPARLAVVWLLAGALAACTTATSATPPPLEATPTSSGASVATPASEATPTATSTLPGGLGAFELTAQAASPVPGRPTPVPTATPEGTYLIIVADYFFQPAQVTIPAGTTVIWRAKGSVWHTIVPRDPPDAFPMGNTAGTGSPDVLFTFSTPGTYHYFCDYHPGAMDAIITVVEG